MPESYPDSYWWHIDRAYRETSIYDGAEVFEAAFKKLSPHIGDLLAAHWFLSEVSNGGIMQFFLNPTAVLAPEAIEAFAHFGQDEISAVLKRCVAKLGPTYPREHEERIEKICRLAGTDDASTAMSAKIFVEEESEIYRIGGDDLGRIYDRMDAYAKEKKE